MRSSKVKPAKQSGGAPLWDLLTFDRLLTGPVIHLIYWSGLGLIVLFGCTVVGAAVGVALRDGSLAGALLAIPVVVAGFLVLVAMVLIWRGFCELYVAVFRIAEDLREIRLSAGRDGSVRLGASAPLGDSPNEPPV